MNKLQELELEEIEDILQRAEDTEKVGVERFKIEDLENANWALKKLKVISERIREVENLAQKEIEPYELEISEINKWKDAEIKAFDRKIEFFSFLLEQYYREQRELNPKFKLSTPNGKVSSRKQQPSWNYEDEKLIGYIENYSPNLIRIKKEIDKAGFKKAVAEENGFAIVEGGKIVSNTTGEYLEGITVEERPDTISIKVVE